MNKPNCEWEDDKGFKYILHNYFAKYEKENEEVKCLHCGKLLTQREK